MTAHDEQESAELNAALRDATSPPPLDDVNWNALHGRITLRAGTLLQQRREQRNVWQTLSGWGRRGIPLTMAAAAAVLLALGLGVQRVDRTSEFGAEEELLSAGLNGESTLLASSSDDELLDALLFNDEGER